MLPNSFHIMLQSDAPMPGFLQISFTQVLQSRLLCITSEALKGVSLPPPKRVEPWGHANTGLLQPSASCMHSQSCAFEVTEKLVIGPTLEETVNGTDVSMACNACLELDVYVIGWACSHLTDTLCCSRRGRSLKTSGNCSSGPAYIAISMAAEPPTEDVQCS